MRLADQVQIHPTRYAQGLAAAMHGNGSLVFEGTRALGVDEGAPCRVRTAGGTVRAEHVVVATHYPFLDRGLYFARLKPQRSYCIAARLASGAPPQGMSISAGSPTRSVRSAGDLLIVGGESHSAGARAATPERFERLAEFAAQALGRRGSRPIDGRPRTPSTTTICRSSGRTGRAARDCGSRPDS